MLRNYLRIALRNLRRQRGYAMLNVVGLALGLAACLLIGAYILDELRTDRFHPDVDRLYRVVLDEQGTPDMAITGPGFALTLPDAFPEMEAVTRVSRRTSGVLAYTDAARGIDRRFEEDAIVYADPSFFSTLGFALAQGDPATALGDTRSIVLAPEAAARYFGDADPLGQTLVLDGNTEQPFTVTGVLAEAPGPSHLRFDFVAPYMALLAKYGIPYEINSFFWPNLWTYVRLQPGADPAAIEARMEAYEEANREAAYAAQFDTRLQPITDIRLVGGYSEVGTLPQVRVFGAIAAFILLLACINFMNLATARSLRRAREVGVRKAVGARRGQVAAQFFGESVLTALLGLGLALGVAQAVLPAFNDLAGKNLAFAYAHPGFWAALLGAVLVTGLVAGSYPAALLSRFRPAAVLKGTVSGRGGARLRRGLVVFQFTVSVALLIATAGAWRQYEFLRDANLGFDTEQLVVLPGAGLTGGEQQRYDMLEARLEALPEVADVAATNTRPGMMEWDGYRFEAPSADPMSPLLADDEAASSSVLVSFVSPEYLDVLGLETVAGRDFTDAAGEVFHGDVGTVSLVDYDDSDLTTARYDGRGFVVNETLVTSLGWTPDEALGQPLRFFITENGINYQDYRGEVVGVVADAKTMSMRSRVRPQVYQLNANGFENLGYLSLNYVLVKAHPGNAADVLAAMRPVWKDVVPERPYSPAFLDDRIAAQFRAEERMGTVIGLFALLAVAVACLGLFGLASYTAERRRKEIGVRKVLGASVPGLVTLLAKDFLLLVALASVLAAPLAWWALRRWLDGFAFRIDLGPELFLGAIAVALVIALATVAGQSLRAARLDPVKSLRHE